MAYHDTEWFALETNRDHSVIFQIVSKHCNSDSVFDCDDYFISSKGFLPTVVDIMVIWVIHPFQSILVNSSPFSVKFEFAWSLSWNMWQEAGRK